MTNELCQSTCQADGFTLAGTEYAGECCKNHLILFLFYDLLGSYLALILTFPRVR